MGCISLLWPRPLHLGAAQAAPASAECLTVPEACRALHSMRKSKAAGVGKAASGGIFDDDSSSSPEDERKPGRSSTSGRGRLLKAHNSAKAAMPPLGVTERQGSKAGGPSTARGAPPPRGRASTPGRHLLRRASPARSRSPRPAVVAAPAAAAPAAVPSTPTNAGRRATILTTNSGRLTLASIGLLSRTTNTPLRSRATPQQSPAGPTPAAEGFRPSAIIRRPSLPAGLQKQNLHLARLLGDARRENSELDAENRSLKREVLALRLEVRMIKQAKGTAWRRPGALKDKAVQASGPEGLSVGREPEVMGAEGEGEEREEEDQEGKGEREGPTQPLQTQRRPTRASLAPLPPLVSRGRTPVPPPKPEPEQPAARRHKGKTGDSLLRLVRPKPGTAPPPASPPRISRAKSPTLQAPRAQRQPLRDRQRSHAAAKEDAQKAGAGGVREGRKRRDGDDEEEEGEDEGEGEGVSPLGRGASLGAREAQGPATEAAMGPESVHTPIRPKRGVPRVVCYKEPDLHAKIRKGHVFFAIAKK